MLTEFDDDYFDIIYIDADHRYNAVKKDLEITYKKVKIGGIISGHDYATANHPEVYIAVNLFCKEKNLKIKYITKDVYASFAIIKTH